MHILCHSPALFHNSYLDKWCVPFLGPDRSIVYRSEHYKWQQKKQRPVCCVNNNNNSICHRVRRYRGAGVSSFLVFFLVSKMTFYV